MMKQNHEVSKVPEGYKQTEVGIIPEDWEIKTLGEIAIVKSGGTPSTNISQYWDGKVAWCTPTDITSLSGKYLLNTARTISKEGLQNSSAELLPTNTIVMTSRATIGECAIAKVELATNQGFKNFICSDVISYEFLFYLLTSLKDSFISLCSGSTFLEISTTQIRKFSVNIPTLKEQTAIANALSDVDALIAELEKLIAKKEAIKTGAMQQLLTGRTRLPQFAKREDGTPKGYKTSEFGEIPEDWEVVSLDSICSYQNGQAQESRFNSQSGYKVISIGNFSEKGRYLEGSNYIQRGLKSEINRFILNKNDLAMILNDKTAVGTILGRVIYINQDDTYVMNQRTMRLTCNEKVNSFYLSYLLNSDDVHRRIVGMSKPGTQIYINTDDVLRFEVFIPMRIKEQTAIAEILSDMDSEIEALEKRLDKTKTLKQGMMQELLTGRTRLV